MTGSPALDSRVGRGLGKQRCNEAKSHEEEGSQLTAQDSLASGES